MTALLSCDMSNTDKVVLYINECKEHNIQVLPPDINESIKDFNVVNDQIRFGLAAVKNVGDSAIDSIIEERALDGSFTSLSDFCNRIDSRRVNSRVIESLIKSGSFDSLGYKRSQLMTIVDTALEQAKAVQRDKHSGQMSLFGVTPETDIKKATTLNMPDIDEWDEHEKLRFEKETVGFYITGHPLDNSINEIKTITDTSIKSLADCGEGQTVRVGGLFRSFRPLKSKNGSMAFAVLEDLLDTVEVVIFPDIYASCAELLNTTDPVIIQGTIQKNEQYVKIIADTVDRLGDAREKYTESIQIRLHADKISRKRLEDIKKLFYKHHGQCPVLVTLHYTGKGEVDIEPPKDITLKPCRSFSDNVEEILGYQAVSFRKKPVIAKQRKRWKRKEQ